MKTAKEINPQILTFDSADLSWPRFALSLPGTDTEWFSSREVRDTYARLMSDRLGLPIVRQRAAGCRPPGLSPTVQML